MSSTSLTAAEIDSYKESFASFDRNGDGAINESELRSLLRIVGVEYHKGAVQDALQAHDTNNDRHLDFEEFLVLVAKLTKNKEV